ncbi:MAG: hypothetical protein FJW90_02810 [Actinobacteria bacterium]|nr:hypothetical protein [Actinomycetota bacterium]
MGYDDPVEIQQEEARQEFRCRSGEGRTGYAIYDFIALAIAIVGGAIAFETIDNWSQWVVLAAIIFTLIGFMIALSPSRRGSEQH